MADTRRNALRQRLQKKLVEQEKKRYSLYEELIDILKSNLYDKTSKDVIKDFALLSDKEAVKIIKNINKRVSEAIYVYKKNEDINAEVLIPINLVDIKAFLDPILGLCREKYIDSREFGYEIKQVTIQLFDNISKHFCGITTDSVNMIDIPTAYAAEFPTTLYVSTAISCLLKNENIEQAKFYLKQYRKLYLIHINSVPDTPDREGVLKANESNYYAGMALYSFHHGKHTDVKNYLLKAEAALAMARSSGCGFSSTVDSVYRTIIDKKIKEENYSEALNYHKVRLTCSEETIYQYQKVLKDHEIGKRIQRESFLQTRKEFLEMQLKKKKDIEREIEKLALLIEAKSQPTVVGKKETEKEVIPTDLEEENNKNVLIRVSLKKEKRSKKEKKLEKALSLKMERNLISDASAKKTKTIKFNDSYTFCTNPEMSNTFRLFGVKHQYVAITPQLIDEINQLDPSISGQAMKWVHDLCDVGRVLGNSQGMRGFLLNAKKKNSNVNKKYVKVKDASKPWRMWGEKNPEVVEDAQGNKHTLWELKEFVQKHA